MSLPREPATRKEMYLSAIAGENTAIPETPATREEMYLDYIAKNGGGGGGTTNYNDLTNKPSINNISLQGNKTLDDLGIASKEYVDDAIAAITDYEEEVFPNG